MIKKTNNNKRRKSPRDKPMSFRIAAWVHTIINPITDNLSTEKILLEEGNISWRFTTEKCEFILPLKRYVNPAHLHNYEDFMRGHPQYSSLFDKHDNKLKELEKLATAICQFLCDNQSFTGKVNSFLQQYESRTPKPEYPGGAIPKDKLPCLMAQHLINEVKELPVYYTDAKFWAEFQFSLDVWKQIQIEIDKRYNKNGNAFDALKSGKSALFEIDKALDSRLSDLRFDLCEKYDIPADPSPYTGHMTSHEEF